MSVPIDYYAGLKRLWDAVQKGDDHVLALKQSAPEAAQEVSK